LIYLINPGTNTGKLVSSMDVSAASPWNTRANQAVGTDDDNGLAHYNLGNQLFLWKRYKDALKEFQLAIKQFPKNFKFFYSRALCHFKLKEYDQCIESCEHVAKLIEENHEDLLVHTFILSARALVCVKDLDEAETMFRKAFKAGGEALHDVVQIAYDKFKSK